MSNLPPPDRPTEHLRRPVAPAPVERVVDERVVAPGVDTTAVLLRLEDAVGSLRTGLAVVGVIAVAAAALAVYLLFTEDDRTSGTTAARSGLASDARVSNLDERIDRLSRQVQDARAAARSDDSEALEQRIAALEKSRAPDATQAIEQLSGRIDALERDVEELKQQAAAAP